MREPLRLSSRHWWNYGFAVAMMLFGVSWFALFIDGRGVALGLVAWVVVGWIFARTLLYEHIGFFERHVAHDYAKSARFYRKSVDSGRGTPQCYAALASLCLAEGDTLEAVDLLERVMPSLESDAYAWALFSKALLKAGRQQEALEAAMQCRSLDPRGSIGYVALGDALKAAGSLLEAASAYQESLKRFTDLHDSRVRLAEVYFGLGYADKGLEEVERVLRARPAHADALYWCGKLALLKGDYSRARENLHAALENRSLSDRSHMVSYEQVIATVADLGLMTGGSRMASSGQNVSKA